MIRPERFDEVPTLRSCGFRERRFTGSTATGIEPRFLEADFRHGCLRRLISPTLQFAGNTSDAGSFPVFASRSGFRASGNRNRQHELAVCLFFTTRKEVSTRHDFGIWRTCRKEGALQQSVAALFLALICSVAPCLAQAPKIDEGIMKLPI